MDGLSDSIDGARCQACAFAAVAADLLLGGNKRDAAAAVKTYAKHSVMGWLSFVPQVSINQDGQEERGATMRPPGVVGPTLYDDVAWAQASFATFE